MLLENGKKDYSVVFKNGQVTDYNEVFKKVIIEFHYNDKTLKLLNKKNNKQYIFNEYFEAKNIWNIIIEKH